MPLGVFHNTKINVQQFKTVRMHRFLGIAVVTIAEHAKLSKFDHNITKVRHGAVTWPSLDLGEMTTDT